MRTVIKSLNHTVVITPRQKEREPSECGIWIDGKKQELLTCFEVGCPLADPKTGTCEDECCIAHPNAMRD